MGEGGNVDEGGFLLEFSVTALVAAVDRHPEFRDGRTLRHLLLFWGPRQVAREKHFVEVWHHTRSLCQILSRPKAANRFMEDARRLLRRFLDTRLGEQLGVLFVLPESQHVVAVAALDLVKLVALRDPVVKHDAAFAAVPARFGQGMVEGDLFEKLGRAFGLVLHLQARPADPKPHPELHLHPPPLLFLSPPLSSGTLDLSNS